MADTSGRDEWPKTQESSALCWGNNVARKMRRMREMPEPIAQHEGRTPNDVIRRPRQTGKSASRRTQTLANFGVYRTTTTNSTVDANFQVLNKSQTDIKRPEYPDWRHSCKLKTYTISCQKKKRKKALLKCSKPKSIKSTSEISLSYPHNASKQRIEPIWSPQGYLFQTF
jgi:hypothetical protein